MNLVGVDVDSKLLVCRIRRSGGTVSTKSFNNSPAGYKKFIQWATQRQQTARVCLEATGVYSMPFALALHQAEAIDVMVANPRAIKQFAGASLQRGKTDALDAAVILEYLSRMPFHPWRPPAKEIQELQLITRRIRQLDTERTRERNRQKAALRLGAVGQIIVNDTQVNIKHIERRISRLESAALKLVNATPEHAVRLDLLKSVTGIADKSGMRLLAELACLPSDMRAPQWVAHAGLDPRPYESGSSTNKPRRITKAGNRYLRDALYMPAQVASQKDPHVSAYYNALLNRGKKPMQAIVAVMRKLLICIWGMFKHDQYWAGEKFYKIA